MRLKYICALCLLMLSAEGWALSLEDSINAALTHESNLKQQQLTVLQNQAMLHQAQNRYGLDVNLVGEAGREKTTVPDNSFFPLEGERTLGSLELQFDYPLYTWGRQQLAIQTAQLQRDASKQALSSQRSKTILQTVEVYTDVLKQQAMLHLQNMTNDNLKRSLYEAEKKFKAGVITRADLALVHSQYAQGLADMVTAQSNLSISQENFKFITGLEAENLSEVTNTPTVSTSMLQRTDELEQHSSIKQAKLQLAAAQSQYQLMRKELKPLINLISRVGMQHDYEFEYSRSNYYMVGVQLKLPLFDHGQNKANIEKASVEQQLAQQQLETLRQNLNRNLKQTYTQILALQQHQLAIKEAISASEIAYIYTEKELAVGTKTTFDMLQAEQKLLELKTQLAINQQDEVLLHYKIFDQSGKLDDFYSGMQQQVIK